MGIHTQSGTFFGTYINLSKIEHLRGGCTKAMELDWEWDDLNFELMKILSNAGLINFGEEIEGISPSEEGGLSDKKWVSLVLTTEHYDGEESYFLGVKLNEKTTSKWEQIQPDATRELDNIFDLISPLKPQSTYKTQSLSRTA